MNTDNKRCAAYCTAQSYKLGPLFEFLQTRWNASRYRYIIQIQNHDSSKVAFYFSYGVAVFWGFPLAEEKTLLQEIKPFENLPLEHIEDDEITFSYGTHLNVVGDEFTLPSSDPSTKLAISLGIGQSTKLTVYETAIQKQIEETKHLPEELAKKGRISLSRKEISKKMGQLFIERNLINLHSDILDTPEIFWEYTELEPFYIKASNHFDIARRVDILNKRLNIVHELFEILGEQLEHQHASALEWIIIWLIAIEIILALIKDSFKWFS